MRILSVGVAVIDYVFHVEHFPDRAEKYRALDADIVGGGGGANAAVALARLGAEAWIAARTGADAAADTIRADLSGEGVRTDLLLRAEGRRSSFSSVLVDRRAERQIVNYRDTALPADGEWLRERLRMLEDDGMRFDGVVADTRWVAGSVAAMEHARRHGVPAVMDVEAPAHEGAAALGIATHAVFSAQGLRDFVGRDAPLPDLLHRADAMLDAVVGVTDGADGVRWIEGGTLHHLPPPEPPGPIVDTLGAGDVWHAALALALAEAQPLRSAMGFANAAATLKCTGSGGRRAAPTRPAVETLLRRVGG